MFTKQQIKALQAIADTFQYSDVATLPENKKKPKYADYPIVLGETLKATMINAGITDDEVCANYFTGKGTRLDRAALARYKNVTQKDIDGGQAYSRGVPIRFMQWLYTFISLKYTQGYQA